MRQLYLFNELVRRYNRSRRKFQRLATEGKNLRKQNILQRRIVRLLKTLTGMQRVLKLGIATVALCGGMLLIQPDAVRAQASITFGVGQDNPFGLSYGYNPSFADLDKDGDMDLIAFIGGSFEYFQNTGTAAAPAYASAQINPFGLVSDYAFWNLDVADLDGDGDIDLIAGEYFGNFIYFQNTGTVAAPAFAAPIFNPFGLSQTGNALSPAFADLDGDGDLDLLTGETYGWLRYFQNTGTDTTPAFAGPITEPFGLNHYGAYWTMPEFVDLDGDWDFDLMYSLHPDSLGYCENVGTMFAPDFLPFVTNPFGLPGGGDPSFADLDGDGDIDMIVDGFVYYENTNMTPSCMLPVGSIAVNITGTSVKLKWDPVADAMHYKVRYKEAGTSDWITIPKIKSHSKLITGLTPNTQYYWQLKNVCSVNPRIISEWSEKQSFTTGMLKIEKSRPISIQLYPNPVAENFTVDLQLNSNISQSATIYLQNPLGQIIYLSNEITGNGSFRKEITMPSTASSGWYIVRVVMNDQVIEQKLLYQK